MLATEVIAALIRSNGIHPRFDRAYPIIAVTHQMCREQRLVHQIVDFDASDPLTEVIAEISSKFNK